MRTGARKRSQCGIKDINKNFVQTPAFNVDLLDARVNLYAFLHKYIVMRNSKSQFLNRFFLQFKHNATKSEVPLRRQHLGNNSFTRLIKEMCTTTNVRGNGVHDYMTAHGLLATIKSLLIGACHNEISIITDRALINGHINQVSQPAR